MAFDLSLCFRGPETNPINKKARSIPVFNPINLYGRVFFFSWFGFFVAFWSWYAFPPLLTDIIAKDVGMSPTAVKTSNILSLVATLLVRLVTGPLCDRFGPRLTFAGTLLLGSIPTFCAGGATSTAGILAIRFFVGILGGSFVPCQVWTMGFFDKNVVGVATALTAGLGNSGGGITYFVMPAVYSALVSHNKESSHVAWRVSFVIPGVIIVSTAVAMLLLCPDTPTGKWSDREAALLATSSQPSLKDDTILTDEGQTEPKPADEPQEGMQSANNASPEDGTGLSNKKLTAERAFDTAKGEIVSPPTWSEIFRVGTSPQTLVVAACYFCSFGSELSINSILGSYYTQNSPSGHMLTTQQSGNWAAMFGLLNIVCRPLGGLVSDIAYRYTGSVWAKKMLLHTYSFIMAIFLIVIGKVNPHNSSVLYGLVGGLAFFLEGANGLVFALVPHVFPAANGVVSGFVGASGNLGGIIFSIVFRYNSIANSFWILGVIAICLHGLAIFIRPMP